MKNLITIISLFFNIQISSAFEIEYIHLKSGNIIDAKNTFYDIDQNNILALEVSSLYEDNEILTIQEYQQIVNTKFKLDHSAKSQKMGGDGSGTN